jgi:hypothetical protein
MLTLDGGIPLPPHTAGEFDHGDVDRATGRVFVAHTQAGTVEVLDGLQRQHMTTIEGRAVATAWSLRGARAAAAAGRGAQGDL